MRQTYKPPKCECGAELTHLWERESKLYCFDEITGFYYTKSRIPTVCPGCGAYTLDLLPEGICSYEADEPEKK